LVHKIHNYGIIIVLLLSLVSNATVYGQLNCYYNSCLFNTPQNQPFIEMYIAFNGQSLKAKENLGAYQNSVLVALKIIKDSSIIVANKYALTSPVFSNSLAAPAFIDVQRYPLPNGTYLLELTLADNYNNLNKPVVIKETVQIQFQPNKIESSSIQIVENYKKVTTSSKFSKSGFELTPYTVNYFPESINSLNFYFETYATDTVLGKSKPFVYSYYLESENSLSRLNNYGAFSKQMSAKVNPLLAKIDISKLGTGNYNLVIEVKDETNTIRHQKKYFFQRLNKMVDIVALSDYDAKKTVNNYFGNCNNLDTLKMFVECLWPIADGVDKERIINQSLTKNADLMKNFIVDFWTRRAADTANPLNLWATYYRSVQEVMVLFKCGKQKGYYTDRGRVYLQYGKPNQRAQQTNEPNTFPYEIWQYYRATDATNGQFFSNRKFVFVNQALGDDCYKLIHSNMRGEINNSQWQFEVTRRNTNGISNPDNTIPSGTETNQFNEIYNNPR
jgi:GWxTD domain-containing protein